MEKSKKYFWIGLDLVLFALFFVMLFIGAPALNRYGASLVSARTITVSEEGKATVVPDLAEVSFSVISRGKNPDDLTSNNNQKMNAAIEFVKSQRIDAKDIKTVGYNLNPDYQYDPSTQRNFITGYTLTQTVDLKIRDFQKVAKVIAGLTPLGVNQVGGVNFTVEDPDKFLAEARADAVAKVKAKAQSIAAANGVRLGDVVNISESSGGRPIPYFAAKALDVGMGAGAVSAPTIEPGTEDVTLTESVTYALE